MKISRVLTVSLGVLALMAVDGLGAAGAQARKPGAKPPASRQADIDRQSEGKFPALNRSTLPLGAINRAWSEDANCGEESTTLLVAHSPTSEIRVRLRQLLGTVVAFPETVSLVQKPGGQAFSAKPHGGGEGDAGNVWVLGATKAGLDGNMVFVSEGAKGLPTLYVLHVQAEGFNTKNCPDLLVLIQPAVSKGITRLARSIHNWSESIRRRDLRAPAVAAPIAAAGDDEEKAKADEALKESDTAGRNDTDWIEGKSFDPTKINFDWKVYGEASLAPDIVYSDGVFTYLKFSPERAGRVRIAALSAVEDTSRGAIDTPVNWSIKNGTIVVQGVQRLTLEREGLVVCVIPGDATPPKFAQSARAAPRGSSVPSTPPATSSAGDY